MTALSKQYRAVFGSFSGSRGSHGEVRETLSQALNDRPQRAEETLEYLVSVEVQEVTPWSPVALSTILNTVAPNVGENDIRKD